MNQLDKSLFQLDESISKRGLIRSSKSQLKQNDADMDVDFNISVHPNEMRRVSFFRVFSEVENKSSNFQAIENTTLTSTTFFGANQSVYSGSQTNLSVINKQKTDSLYTQFLEIIISRTNDSEIFETVQDLIQTLSNTIENMESNDRKGHLKNHWLKEEEITWKLLYCLYKDRLITQKEPVEIDNFQLARSEKTIVEHLYLTNENLREYQLIVDWLEQTGNENHVQVGLYTDRTVGWENTLHQLQNIGHTVFGGTRDIVTSLDPDAVYRERRPLHDLDMEDEARLSKQIFLELRRGRIDEAQSLCEHCGQPWRAALLEGWRLHHDPNLEAIETRDVKNPIEGNVHRDLWKKCAWMMSESPKVDEYSRAIAAVFCGNLEALTNVLGDSYHDLLWAHLKVQIDICVESELRSSYMKSYVPMPDKYLNGRKSLEKIFDELEAHKNSVVKTKAKSTICVIQKYLILDDIPGLMKHIDEWLEDDFNSKIAPQMLRFLTHIVLFIRQIGKNHQEEIGDRVIKAYVKCLIKMGNAQLIAFYTAALPMEIQNQLYSEFLETIDETMARKMCLEEAQSHGLDVFAITTITVQRIRNYEEDPEEMRQLKGQLSPLDLKKVLSLEWLTFYPEQRGELLWQANAMMRSFLAASKVEAVKKAFSVIPADTIQIIINNFDGKSNLPFKVECSIKEYVCHQTYLAAIDGYSDWIGFYYNGKPKEPNQTKGRNFAEKVAAEHQEQVYRTELARWKENLLEQTNITKDLLYNILIFPERGWLVDPEDTLPDNLIETWQNRQSQMENLRKLLIPEIVLLLHKILSLSGQHKDCLKLADEIASDVHKIYTVYSKHKLAEILAKIAESALAGLSAPEKTDPFGYTLSN
jgi:nuclear pore complex protein Nup107